MSQPVKIISRTNKARAHISPDNPLIHRHSSPAPPSSSQNQTLPRNPKLQLANLTPYENPLTLKTVKSKSRTQIKPHLNSSFSVSKLTKQNSLSESIINSSDVASLESPDCKEELTPSTQASIDKAREAFALEYKLNEQMKTLGQRSPMNSDKFRIFQEIWDELLSKQTPFKHILELIRGGYEEWIANLLRDCENKGETIYKLTSQLEEEKNTLKLLKKRFKRLAQENMQINSDLGTKDKIIQELKAHLSIISNSTTREKEITKNNLEMLQKENLKVKAYLTKSEERSRGLKEKLKVLRKLIKVIKNKGFPVEDLYESEIKAKPATIPTEQSRKSLGSFLGTNPMITLSSVEGFEEIEKNSSCDFRYSPSIEPSTLTKGGDTFLLDDTHDLTDFQDQNSDSRFIKDL
ncbi:unnamed protein product [Blepharisma stoltei]|uniref:Translin-associated factor X-interacting protein 1 N-terminal domain-containing protein n=1 Tax=Blepharisma stoltei TaxID=1481888 RepID=A0AAU9JNT1_9CILI|nr:unnamed protein product [Blepharisma stoltei]